MEASERAGRRVVFRALHSGYAQEMRCNDWRGICALLLVVLYTGTRQAFAGHHLVSAGNLCTVRASFNSSVSLLCMHRFESNTDVESRTDILSGTSGSAEKPEDCVSTSARWLRLELDGVQKNVSNSGKYSLWESSHESSTEQFLTLLRINSVQLSDITRYRCELQCQTESGKDRLISQHLVSLCLHYRHQYSICDAHHTSESKCDKVFSDGRCDRECDTERQLYDGFDCSSPTDFQPHCDPGQETRCRRSFADGVCDPDCNTDGCGWDGGDCVDKALRLVEDTMVLTLSSMYRTSLLADPVGSRDRQPITAKDVARVTSRLLRTIVRALPADWATQHIIRKHHGNSPTISDIGVAQHLASFKSSAVLDSSSVDDDLERNRVYLKVDNTNCFNRCFNTAESAARFVLRAIRSNWNPGFTVSYVSIISPTRDECAYDNHTKLNLDDQYNDPVSDAGQSKDSVIFGRWANQVGRSTLIWVVLAAVVGGMAVVIVSFFIMLATRKVYRTCRGKLCLGRGNTGRDDPFGGERETWRGGDRATWSRGKEVENREGKEEDKLKTNWNRDNSSCDEINIMTDILA